MKIRIHILNALAILIMAAALLGGAVVLYPLAPNTFAAGDKLQIVGEPVVYVQSGREAYFQVSVKNISGTELKGVNVAHGFGSMEDYNSMYYDEPYEFHDGFSEMTTQDPRYDEPNTWYRFSRAFEDGRHEAENAVWDDMEEGYTIADGVTAKLWFKVNSQYEEPGTYTDGWVIFGDIHSELVGGFMAIPVYDSAYTGQCHVKVITYNPSAAAITFGTKVVDYGNITPVALGTAINFGTIDLNDEDSLTGERTFYARNTTTISNNGKDEHGFDQNIDVEFSVESTDSSDPYMFNCPLGCNTYLGNGGHWQPLEPVKPNEFMEATVGATLNAGEFVAGTYNAKLRLLTSPHGVKVNGAAIHTNGVYEWPVKVTLTGTNPRIPKAPKNVVATPGNGMVELTWKAADNAEEGKTYWVYRRVGKETDTANINNASFDWGSYECIGSDSPDDDGNYLLVDGSAVNGMTYTYIVIGGDTYKAYPAISDDVKPLSTIQSKLLAPEMGAGSEQLGGIILDWEMNEVYGGSDCDGSAMVDHFNIYRDGVLVMQVQQNAVNAVPNYGWGENPDNPDEIIYQLLSKEYSWQCFVETPEPYQTYAWSVAAVSKSGVEGYMSDPESGYGLGSDLTIINHSASVEVDGNDRSADIDLKMAGDANVCRFDYWRSEGSNAPNTSGSPYYTLSSPYGNFGYGEGSFIDTGIQKGKTYTYTVQATDLEGNKSNFYTFSIKVPNTNEWAQKSFAGTEVTWSVLGGKKAKLEWNYLWEYDTGDDWRYVGTYYVYRNGARIKTVTASGQDIGSFTFENDPIADGTYIYRVDVVKDGITIRGRDYTIVRNTKTVDESTLLKAPGAPILDVRISDGNPVLRWAATDTGGKVDGYHIYRKDAGELVNGRYQTDYNDARWNNMRYISIDDASITSLTDVYGAFMGDGRKGYLDGVSWTEEDCPHEYYITAYNSAGESESSEVFTFGFQGLDGYGNPIYPTNEDETVPAAPTITNIWVDWDDESTTAWDDAIGGNLRIAWKDTDVSSVSIDEWKLSYTGLHSNDTATVYAWQVARDNDIKNGTSSYAPYSYVDARPAEEYTGDFGRTAKVTVTAKNSAGENTSETAELIIRSFPRSRVTAGNGYALVQWTDLFEDAETQVNSWEIWRKREGGAWTNINTISASGLDYAKDSNGEYKTDYNGIKNYEWKDESAQNGWDYEYKIVAKCTDGADRPSVVRSVRPCATAATEAPGAPQNLTYTITNGEVLFTWSKPATGQAQYYKLMYYDEYYNAWFLAGDVNAPSTSYVWSQTNAGTYQVFVYATAYINGEEVPQGAPVWDDEATLEEKYPSMSNTVTVNITDAHIDQQAETYPGAFDLTATPGENKVTLSWTAAAGATYYTISRLTSDGDSDSFNTVEIPATQRTYTDNTALPGVRYQYTVKAGNVRGEIYNNVYAIATGKSKDEIIADEVKAVIEGLPDPDIITVSNYLEYANQVDAANEQYESLTAKQKKLIPGSYKDKLLECVDKIEQIRLNTQYAETVLPIQNMIDQLPDVDDISLDDEDAVISARAAYNALPSDAKKLVDTSKLIAAEQKIKALKKAANDQQIVDALLEDLSDLESMEDVTAENAESILNKTEALYGRINDLDPDQKAILYGAEGSDALLTKLAETDARAKAVLGLEHTHLSEFVNEAESTCTEPGHITCYTCKACGKYFSDAACNSEIDYENAIIPVDPNKHDWGEWVVTEEPTCNREGVKTRFCVNDNDHYETVTLGVTAHDWKSTPESKTNNGGVITQVYKCKNCDTTRTVTINTDPDSQCNGEHDWDWDDPVEQKAPSCTSEGYTRYRCKNDNCGNTIMEVQEIDPSAHDWGDWETVTEATCTASGRKIRKCCNDENHQEEEIIDAKGHNWGDGTVVSEATCTEAGRKDYKCSACGLERTEVTAPDPDNHDWTDTEWTWSEDHLQASAIVMCKNDNSHIQTVEAVVTTAVDGSGNAVYTAKISIGGKEFTDIFTEEKPQEESTRIFGKSRYDTAKEAADEYKSITGKRFENVVVAYGENFPDALSGGYLAKVKNAPILLVRPSVEDDIVNYISNNIAAGGKVYILGGVGAVSAAFENKIIAKGIETKRLGGKDRYATNLAILKEAGVDNEEILVCTGAGFADSLSASAAGRPILLVGSTLSDVQKEYIQTLNTDTFYLIGGTGAVSAKVETGLRNLGYDPERVAGSDRYVTSTKVAERFFDNPQTVVLAYAQNFPDGLSGGPLAMKKNAPIILTNSSKTDAAKAYVKSAGATSNITLGGASLISDMAVKTIMGR